MQLFRRLLLGWMLSMSMVVYCQAQVFTASPNQLCNEGTFMGFTQAVSGLSPASNSAFGFYEVCVTLNHPLASDVTLAIQSPAGSYLQLVNANGGNANFTSACFRLYATHSIRYSAAPFNGAYMAYNNLRDLINGQNPNGTWTLYYTDNVVNGIKGTLVSWSISFQTNPEMLALNNASSNIPIFKIDVPSGYIPDQPKVPGTLKVIDNAPGLNPFSSSSFSLTSNLLIEKQGFTSSGGSKPNYDFQLMNTAGSSDTLIDLLGLPAESDWIIKSCYTDEYFMKDPLTFEMSRRMNYYAPRTRTIEVMLNGVYAGVYILEEKVKRGANRVNIAKLKPTDTTGAELTGGYIFEINPNGDPAAWWSNYPGYQGPILTSPYEFKLVYPHQSTIPPVQLNYLHAFVDSFEDALHGPNYQDPVNGWRKYGSENDFINFLIVSEYSTNYDTYGRSTYLYKEKVTDGNKIHIGPPWDSDRGYESDTGWVHIITHGYWIYPFWWQRFRTDSVFNAKLACRFATLRQTVFTDSAFLAFIDSAETVVEHAAQRDENRWQSYVEDIQVLKNHITTRLAWMDAHLSGSIFPPPPLTQTVYCAGDPIDIFIGNQYTYNFQPGPDTSYFIPTTAGTYHAVVSSTYGCKTYQAITVTPHPQPVINGNAYPCRNSDENYTVSAIPGATCQWQVYGGTLVSGGGSTDTFCHVHWGNPTFCMVTVRQSLSVTCTDSASKPVTIKTCTGLHETTSASQPFIYPVPVKEQLILEGINNVKDVKLFDMTGHLLRTYEGGQHVFFLNDLSAGIYMLRVVNDEGEISQFRFAKE